MAYCDYDSKFNSTVKLYLVKFNSWRL